MLKGFINIDIVDDDHAKDYGGTTGLPINIFHTPLELFRQK